MRDNGPSAPRKYLLCLCYGTAWLIPISIWSEDSKCSRYAYYLIRLRINGNSSDDVFLGSSKLTRF